MSIFDTALFNLPELSEFYFFVSHFFYPGTCFSKSSFCFKKPIERF